jgi:hypothetical protein
VKNIHGEEVFRQKKHKRIDDNNDKQFEEIKENISNIIPILNIRNSNELNNQSNILIENNNNDDDEDVIVDQGIVDVN